jgi:hypothetical protein
MIEALIAGELDPRRLADLARGKMKVKRSALINAPLDGRFDDHHGELARMLLDQIEKRASLATPGALRRSISGACAGSQSSVF